MNEKVMVHITTEDRNRINQLAEKEKVTQQAMLTRLIDSYLQPKDLREPPVATRSMIHKVLLVYGAGATLRIDSEARPYICVPDGTQWQRLEFGKIQTPWEWNNFFEEPLPTK